MVGGKSMKERRRGIGPAAAEYLDIEQQRRISVDGSVEPLCLAINLDVFLIDSDP